MLLTLTLWRAVTWLIKRSASAARLLTSEEGKVPVKILTLFSIVDNHINETRFLSRVFFCEEPPPQTMTCINILKSSQIRLLFTTAAEEFHQIIITMAKLASRTPRFFFVTLYGVMYDPRCNWIIPIQSSVKLVTWICSLMIRDRPLNHIHQRY